MPQKNTLKTYVQDSYYHVYSRGTNKQRIFNGATDYYYFEGLLERYLGSETHISKTGSVYPNYRADIRLLAYCLMPNHIHLLVYQMDDVESLQKFMRSLLTSYSKYFNLRYKRVGALFESRYKAKRIETDNYLAHISRYIHMNPRHWQTWRHSSLQYVFSARSPDWLATDEAVQDFSNREEYLQFLLDYQEQKDVLEDLKQALANT